METLPTMQSKQLDDLKALLGAADGMTAGDVKKALTAATGFSNYNLEPLAKLLLPVMAPLTARTPVDNNTEGGDEVHFKSVNGFGAFNWSTAFGGAEAAIGQDVSITPLDVAAKFVTQPLSNSVTLAATLGIGKFDDGMALAVRSVLSALERLHEYQTIGGNYTALAAPANLAVTPFGAGAYDSSTFNYSVTALSLRGVLACMASLPAKVGTYRVGEGVPCANVAGSNGGQLGDLLTWDAVPGAFGYVVYAGTAGTKHCTPSTMFYPEVNSVGAQVQGDPIVPVTAGQSFVTTTGVQVTAATTVSGSADQPTTDGSANAGEIEGYKANVEKSTVYATALGTTPTIIDKNGMQLTPIAGGIQEFDQILELLFRVWNISPTLILTSPNGANDIGAKILTSSGNVQNVVDFSNERGGFQGGLFVGSYTNKFVSMIPGVPQTVPIWGHPYCPDGTIMFLSEYVPYPYTDESRGFAREVRLPYTYWPLASVDIRWPFSILYDETLKCYFPSAQASIVGVRQAA